MKLLLSVLSATGLQCSPCPLRQRGTSGQSGIENTLCETQLTDSKDTLASYVTLRGRFVLFFYKRK